MREVSFIKQNKANWLEFEKYLYQGKKVDAHRLSELFDKVTNDLAYAQTYYPKSKLNLYLNALASNAYLKVTKTKSTYGSILTFWTEDVPKLTYKYRKIIYATFAVFLILIGIGVLSSLYDEGFVRSILGNHYVDTSLENIANGDPAAIYTNETVFGDIGSFLGITFNNIRVGLLLYISGITLGIGTLKILFSNCIMLGSFLTMFQQQDVLAESMSAIWIHGAMEIFSMVIEASAGFLLGLGWLFPGALSRKQAFFLTGKESLMIVMSTIPFTIAAGLFEGFVTQLYNDVPSWISVAIIFLTLGLISYYYLIFPVRKYKNAELKLSDIMVNYDD